MYYILYSRPVQPSAPFVLFLLVPLLLFPFKQMNEWDSFVLISLCIWLFCALPESFRRFVWLEEWRSSLFLLSLLIRLFISLIFELSSMLLQRSQDSFPLCENKAENRQFAWRNNVVFFSLKSECREKTLNKERKCICTFWDSLILISGRYDQFSQESEFCIPIEKFWNIHDVLQLFIVTGSIFFEFGSSGVLTGLN